MRKLSFGLIIFLSLISINLIAQNKWDSLIYKLRSVEETDHLYPKLLVEIAWQISELEPDTADYYALKALTYAEVHNDDSIKCRALVSKSVVESYRGNHSLAIELSFEAIRIAEKLPDSLSLMDGYNNVGIDLYYLNDFEGAILYYERLIDIAQLVGNYSQLGYGYNNVAMIEGELGNVDKEIEYYEKSLEAFYRINEVYGIANTKINLGTTLNNMGEHERAIKNLSEAYESFLSMDNSNGVADALTIWAQVLLSTGDFNGALNLLNESDLYCQKYGLTLQQKANDQIYYQVYQALGQKDKAFDYLLSYHQDFKESRESEHLSLIADMKESYEAEKKEQEISRLSQENQIIQLQSEQAEQRFLILLFGSLFLIAAISIVVVLYRLKTRSNQKLQQANEQLEQLNRTKNRLFSIISHDLKSPLSSFHLITKSLTDNWDNLQKDQLKDFLITLRDSSANVRDMMDNLLKWALAQTDQLQYDPESLNPVDVINGVKSQLQSVAQLKETEIRIQQHDSLKIEADKDFLEIIVRNLISNALKYSDVQKRIDVIISSEDNCGVIAIKDQGVGMDQEQVDSLLSGNLVAHDIQNSSEKGTGLGLMLCKELVQRMNGSIEVTSKRNEGTIFRISFPKAA